MNKDVSFHEKSKIFRTNGYDSVYGNILLVYGRIGIYICLSERITYQQPQIF